MKKNPIQYGLFLALVALSIAAGGLLAQPYRLTPTT
jgi:hypothetical protein